MNSKISDRIDALKDQMIAMQKAIMPIKAVSPINGGTGERKKALYLEAECRKIFDSVERIDSPMKEAEGEARPNIVCRMKGKDPSRTIWFMAHMDVVTMSPSGSATTTHFTAPTNIR